jgi:hypothetical protein
MTALVLLGAFLGALALPPTRRRCEAEAAEQAARPHSVHAATAAQDAAALLAARLREEQP